MGIVNYFIKRPIFAGVVSILIFIAGLLSLKPLPLAEYPQVTPPTIVVRANYPGANPEVIAQTVAAPLEQEINGVDGMQYMTSHASGDGRLNITITFAQGIDPESAEIAVQNRVSRAVSRLPEEVQRLGVSTQKTSPDMLMVVHLVSPNKTHDILHLYNFGVSNIKDELARLEGVDDVVIWGAGEYSLRVWVDPGKLIVRGLTVSDVVAVIREQNIQVAAGSIGQPPDNHGSFQVAINAGGRYSSIEEFENIVVKTDQGSVIRLKDVARIELGANRYALRSLLNNEQAAGMQIIQSTDSSAIATAARVRAAMQRLQASFPEDMEYRIAYDPTIFVQASIKNVIQTLLEAMLLVVVVVIVFLKSWRAAIIPMLAVPVSLVGTFAVMHLFGYSLNTLSLFGLVLSIGIVVDDAIVVVENVERHLHRGLNGQEAAIAAMREVTGPIVAITMVLAAIFIPTAFLSGLTGQFYSQFAITITISTIISAINSLTLSPALAAVLLRNKVKHVADQNHTKTPATQSLFARLVHAFTSTYTRLVGRLIRVRGLVLLVYAGIVILTGVGFNAVPKGFVPMQDKYYLVGIAQLPSGASLDRTEQVVRRFTDIALAENGVQDIVAFPGLSIDGFITNPAAAVFFVMLKPFDERTSDDLSANAIAARLFEKSSQIEGAFVGIFPPPPVPGIGNVAGFKMQIQDQQGRGVNSLNDAVQKVVAAAQSNQQVAGVYSNFRVDTPQLKLNIDRTKAKLYDVPLENVYQALQFNFGSGYVNDFSWQGRTYQVFVQAESDYRQSTQDINRLYARSQSGHAVPLNILASIEESQGPDPVVRYNAFVAADINGVPAAGVSSNDAILAIEKIVAENLPEGFSYAWTDLTYQQQQAGDSSAVVFTLAVLFAFLILAALYNSWSIPFAVISILPTVIFSSLVGVWLVNSDNNIFSQIGFIVLLGLATKNAILIVEFARQREQEGASVLRAVLEATKLRLRPIIMTSIAFIMGVVPLIFSSGAGAEMRFAMGIAVFSGMIGVTVFGLLLTPLFYITVRTRWWTIRNSSARKGREAQQKLAFQ